MRKKGAANLKAAGRPAPAIDPSDPGEFDKQENSPPPAYATSPPSRNGTQRQGGSHNSTPTSARGHASPVQEAPQESRGWFGFGRKNKQPDVERAELRRNERSPNQQSPVDRYPVQQETQDRSTRLQKNSRA